MRALRYGGSEECVASRMRVVSTGTELCAKWEKIEVRIVRSDPRREKLVLCLLYIAHSKNGIIQLHVMEEESRD